MFPRSKGKGTVPVLLAALFLTGMGAVMDVPTAEAQVVQIVWDTDRNIWEDVFIASNQELVVTDGATIFIDPGINITIDGNITVLGTPGSMVSFTWNITGQEWGAIFIWNAPRGSHFYNCFVGHGDHGIYASGSDLHVEDSTISYNLHDGIHVYNANAEVLDSEFMENGDDTGSPNSDSAIYLNNAAGLIEGNNIFDNNIGIFMKEGSTAEIKGNNITQSDTFKRGGIILRSGSEPHIVDNYLAWNYAGIICNSSKAEIHNNTIERNTDDGVLFVTGDSTHFHDNLVRDNGDDGIDMNNGSTSRIEHNDIYNNWDNGVLIWAALPSLKDNDIHHNYVGVMVTEAGNLTSSRNRVFDNLNSGFWIGEGSEATLDQDHIENNTITGVGADNSVVNIYHPVIDDHIKSVRALDRSTVYIENGSLSRAFTCNLEMDMSNMTVLNITVDSWNKCWDGTASLGIKWYLGIEVLNRDLQPFPGVNISVIPNPGSGDTVHATTNANGKVDWLELFQSVETVDSGIHDITNHTPYKVNASLGNYSEEVNVTLDMSENITIILDIPNSPPSLKALVPDVSFPEDTDAYGLIDLSDHFLGATPLNYSLVYEEEVSKIDGEVNGTMLDFLTPTENWYGVRRFRARATDDFGAYTESNNFTVEVLPVNDPPVLHPIANMSVDVDATLDFQLNASDVDNELSELTFKTDDIFIPEINVLLDPATGAVRFSSMLEGLYTVRFYVCDPGPLCSANITANITVHPGNGRPEFTTDPLREAYIGARYTYLIGIFDPDGDDLDLEIRDGPLGMELAALYLNWTPTLDQVGSHSVALWLSDGINDPVWQNFTVQVIQGNRPPEAEILRPADRAIFDEGDNISFSGRAFDQDWDVLTYSWRVDGAIVSHDLGMSRALDQGTHEISFGVSDGSITVYHNITITVKRAEPPPKAYNTTIGGDEWGLWLPILLISIMVLSVVLYNKFGHQGPG